MKRFAVLVTGVATLALAAPADAALLQFTISGLDTLSGVVPAPVMFASFQIDSTPVIDPANTIPGVGFAIADIVGTYRYGSTTLPSPQSITFYPTEQNGGLFIGDGMTLAFDGPQIYTGTEANPTFLTGSFTLTRFQTGSPALLTIQAVTAIPEPASWATMLVGFGMIGGASRYRRRKAVVAYA